MEMKASLARVAMEKSQRKSQLARLRDRYLVHIYSGLANGEGVRSIHRKLMEETLRQRKQGLATSDNMLNVAIASASMLRKKVGSPTFVAGYVKTTYGSIVDDSTQRELLAIFVFDLIGKDKVEKKLSHEITVASDMAEGDAKSKAIEEQIEGNRELGNPRIFYLASTHRDSASDHEPYQGKVYVDEKWRSSIKDEWQKREIEQYIARNGVKTVQWVTGKPVWFITRPNCRHYLTALPVDEVLGTPRTKLLKKHRMDTAIGDRQYLQTIRHSTGREWYADIRNAQLLLEKYRERLRLHQEMYASVKNEIVKRAIDKDRMLIDKWERFIAENSN